VARLVRADGPKVCVFPINGTRRWFMLEHPEEAAGKALDTYLEIAGEQLVRLYDLFFGHGVDTLLIPVFGPDLMERGDEYMQQVVGQGLQWFTHDQSLWDFCRLREVRVRIYGDARRYLKSSYYVETLNAFEEAIESHTAEHNRHRLFFGVCAHDPTEQVAEIAIQCFQENNRPPNRREVVEAYYGEYVEPVDFFIGFDRPAAFDMPLVATGSEDLYFTVSPSLYLDAYTLRSILHDHIFTRHVDEVSYEEISPLDWQVLDSFYALNRRSVLGLGHRHSSGHFWFPLPQVKLPDELKVVGES
jgi:tuberculosinol/isotuberculosinol synthase